MTIVLIIYALLVAALTHAEYRRNRTAQAWLKPAAAIGFILIAIFGGAIYWKFGQIILAGLVACAIGDVLLLSRESPLKFKLGMAAFAIGHLLYTYAFIAHVRFDLDEYTAIKAALATIVAGLLYYTWIKRKLPPGFKIPVIVYSIIIIAMVIVACGVPIWMIPVAAFLFAISDMFVAKDRFVDDDPLNPLAITPLYFGAQALFALAAGAF